MSLPKNTIRQISRGVTPLKASAAMDVRGESGKAAKNTMLAGPQVRTMASAWSHWAPINCKPRLSADELSPPSTKANSNALKAEAIANTSTMTLTFLGCRMPKATTKASAGNMGKKLSNAEKPARKKMVLGCAP